MDVMIIEKPDVRALEVTDNYGKFVVEPLERGYGTTLGNSIRRVLLSSIPGAAATSVKFDGVQHEFTTIEGVREDVTEIILNIKNLAIRITDGDGGLIVIDATTEGAITAADIKCPENIEIVNPDLHIATLGKGAKLFAEITVQRGTGYVSAERNKQLSGAIIGVIPVDSIYTPSHKVNYTVENARVGQVTDFDKLTLEVWTNGTIRPDDAVATAAGILSEHVNLLRDMTEIGAAFAEQNAKKAKGKKPGGDDLLSEKIEVLDLSVRSYNCLKRADLHLIRDLAEKSQEEMARIKNMGKKSFDEVIGKLKDNGIILKETEE
ncbi:MAG: DNA-directed RNA polymerase subunit alpha [Oscillospiraceae bacterium]|nr:DNA-directed RNA polymerase subunit alpha [Oscillospiraceae bacterium]